MDLMKKRTRKVIVQLINQYGNEEYTTCSCGNCNSYIFDRQQKNCDMCGATFEENVFDVEQARMHPNKEEIKEATDLHTAHPVLSAGGHGLWQCGVCNTFITVIGSAYCPHCGQRLKW